MKRYNIEDPCEQWRYARHPNGAWVKYEDVQAEIIKLRRLLDAIAAAGGRRDSTLEFVISDHAVEFIPDVAIRNGVRSILAGKGIP